jgi:superfamily I DNA/RNA helicase
MREEENDSIDLDFDSDNPKVLTFHSSKGLQFETIFIPFCDYPNHDNWFKTKYQNPLYVGMTRTYKYLYISHSDRLSPFLNDIPPTSYA